MKNVKMIVLDEDSLGRIVPMAFCPFEILELLFGFVSEEVFIVLDSVPLSLNLQILERRIPKILEDEMALKEMAKNRMSGCNSQLLGFFERMVIIYKEFSDVIKKLNKLTASTELSFIIAHNHPVILPKNLTDEEIVFFQMAYDLSKEKISFSDWLLKFQPREFSKEDIDVIRSFSPDGLGILVFGKKIEDARGNGIEWFDEFLTACQVNGKAMTKIEVSMVNWKEFKLYLKHCEIKEIANKLCRIIGDS